MSAAEVAGLFAEDPCWWQLSSLVAGAAMYLLVVERFRSPQLPSVVCVCSGGSFSVSTIATSVGREQRRWQREQQRRQVKAAGEGSGVGRREQQQATIFSTRALW